MAAGNLGSARDSRVSARLFRTNLNEAFRLQFAGKSAGLFARSSGTRRRISRHARARDETVRRFAAERRDASLLARRRHRERFCHLPGVMVGERIDQCRF